MASDQATSQPTTTSTNQNHPTTPPTPAPANQNQPTTTPRGETDPTSTPAPEGGASAGTEADQSEAREGSGVESGSLLKTGTISVATGTGPGVGLLVREGLQQAHGTCHREGSEVLSELTEGWTEAERIRENMEEIEVEEEAEEVVVAVGEVLGQVEELEMENRREKTEGVGRLEAPLRRWRWHEGYNLDQPGSEKEVLMEVMENE
ncbi:unnamed protein product [Arctogadus glacialis]